jgi:hypothetical protein
VVHPVVARRVQQKLDGPPQLGHQLCVHQDLWWSCSGATA